MSDTEPAKELSQCFVKGKEMIVELENRKETIITCCGMDFQRRKHHYDRKNKTISEPWKER